MKAKKFCVVALIYNNGERENYIVYNRRDVVEKANYLIQCCRLRKINAEVITTFIRLKDTNCTEQDFFNGKAEIEYENVEEIVKINFPTNEKKPLQN